MSTYQTFKYHLLNQNDMFYNNVPGNALPVVGLVNSRDKVTIAASIRETAAQYPQLQPYSQKQNYPVET